MRTLGVRRNLPMPYGFVRAYLAWNALTSLSYGLVLLLSSLRSISGRSTTVLYQHATPRYWGLGFLALSALCVAGAVWAMKFWRPAMLLLGAAEFAWALGLLLPLMFRDSTNALPVIPWAALAGTTMILALRVAQLESR